MTRIPIRSFGHRLRLRLSVLPLAVAMFLAVFLGLRAQGAAAKSQSDTRPTTPMKTFVIIFRQGPHALTPAELALRQQEVGPWARTQNAAGHRLEPRILAPEALHPGTAKPAEAFPITALLFLEAHDLAEAGRIAESHPAKNYGASVEVRPWARPAAPLVTTP